MTNSARMAIAVLVSLGSWVSSVSYAADEPGVDAKSASPWYFPTVDDYRARLERGGFTVELGDQHPITDYAQALTELGGVERARQRLGEPDTDAMRVAVLEFVLEGLHLGKRLNKTALDGSAVYGG